MRPVEIKSLKNTKLEYDSLELTLTTDLDPIHPEYEGIFLVFECSKLPDSQITVEIHVCGEEDHIEVYYTFHDSQGNRVVNNFDFRADEAFYGFLSELYARICATYSTRIPALCDPDSSLSVFLFQFILGPLGFKK